MLYVKEASGTVAEVAERVGAATINNKFGIIGTIDLKDKMVSKGVEFRPECYILEVCNPKQARKVLEGNMAVSTALPCRISIYEEDGKVKVATIRPTAMLKLFGEAELNPVAQEVEETMLRIIDAACE